MLRCVANRSIPQVKMKTTVAQSEVLSNKAVGVPVEKTRTSVIPRESGAVAEDGGLELQPSFP